MKILNKKVINCDTENWKEKVLEIEYSHRKTKGKIQIREYDHLVNDAQAYNHILKQLRIQVRNHFNNQKVLKQHNKERAIA